ncbi:MAG: substrate-binding domain-containing protein [Candidatus Planktophila sp.]|nr:substrate-binding domain-containing protein [Candidatus Planktophila sp.]
MTKRYIVITAVLVATVIALTGCSTLDKTSGILKSGEHTEGFVGVILPGSEPGTRWETSDRRFLQAAFDAAGVKVDIQNANRDKVAFVAIADQMISSGAKVLILVNLDSDSAKTVQDKAATLGVKTIDYDRLTLNGSASYYVSFYNLIVGRLQGEGIQACLEAAGKKSARIVYLNGSPTDNNATLFKIGYDSVLRPFIDSKSYTLVDDQDVPDWDRSMAGVIFEQMLSKAGGKIDAVVAANEGLGLEAVAVLKKKKLNGTVCVSGQDATVDGLRAILTGDLSVTVYKAIKAEAEAAVTLAVALLKGAVPTNITGSEFNGAIYVPTVLLTPVAITKAKVKDVIADGFQKRDDVCKDIEALCRANGI